MDVEVDEALPFDVNIHFQCIILGEIRAESVVTLKAGETKTSWYTFQIGGFWSGYCGLTDWYDGGKYDLSPLEDTEGTTTILT